MAKTQWQDGSHITPAFMQAFAGTNGGQGHAHDAADADGSCPKIVLSGAAQVQGLLPLTSLDTYEAGDIDVNIPTPFADTPVALVWKYIKIGDLAIVFIDSSFCHSTANDYFEVEPDTSWPAAIVPAAGHFLGGLYTSDESASGVFKLGAVEIPASSSGNWVFKRPDASGELLSSGWGFNNTAPKGIFETTICYFVP